LAEVVEGKLIGGLIDPLKPWDLGHPDGVSTGGPEHRKCNRAKAGKGVFGWRTSREW
jgi:hypothetical protein